MPNSNGSPASWREYAMRKAKTGFFFFPICSRTSRSKRYLTPLFAFNLLFIYLPETFVSARFHQPLPGIAQNSPPLSRKAPFKSRGVFFSSLSERSCGVVDWSAGCWAGGALMWHIFNACWGIPLCGRVFHHLPIRLFSSYHPFVCVYV